MSYGELERLTLRWQNRMHEARAEMNEASMRTHEIYAHIRSSPSSDGHYDLRKAMRAEATAIREYARVVVLYYHLAINNRPPNEEP